MSPKYGFPALLAALGFLILIDIKQLFSWVIGLRFQWHNESLIQNNLRAVGKKSFYDYENFKIAELSAILIFSGLVFLLTILNLISIQLTLPVIVFGATGIFYFFQWNLSRLIKKRKARIELEFPAIIEILMLSVSAGDSPAAAFRRIAKRSHGILSAHISLMVEKVEKGSPISIALEEFGKEFYSESIRRFVDSIIIASTRGTSLVEILHNAVEDAHSREKSQLLTSAGKKEIAMLIPVVFLILPISIAFALFPSITQLNLIGI